MPRHATLFVSLIHLHLTELFGPSRSGTKISHAKSPSWTFNHPAANLPPSPIIPKRQAALHSSTANSTEMSRSTPLRGDAPAFYPSNNPPHASRHVAPAQTSNLPYYSHHSASAHPVSIPYYAHHFAAAHPVNPSYSPHYVAPAQSLIPAQLPQAITPIHFPNPTHSFHHVAPVQHHHLPKLAPRPPYQQHSQPSDFIPPRPIAYPRTRKYPAQPAAFFQRHLPPPPVSLRPIPGPPLPPPRPSRPLIYVPPPRPGPSRLSTQPPLRAPRLFPKTNNRLMPPTRQPQCAFLARLPGELRNKIYKLTLISHEPIRAVRSIDDDN